MQKNEKPTVTEAPQRDSKGRFVRRGAPVQRTETPSGVVQVTHTRVIRDPLTPAQQNRKIKARAKSRRAKASRKANR